MSKYNLTNILNEYIGGSRHGTINISYRDLQDAMDQVEANGDFIVRELSGPSGDGKVNREFEVVFIGDVKGDNKQEELGFTVYDYKFGFDPASENNFDEVLPFSIGGSNKEAALKIAKYLLGNRAQGYMARDKDILKGFDPKDINDVLFKDEVVNEENVTKDLAKADEVIKIIKMMNPDVREDLLKRIARMGQKLNEGDLFSSKFDRQELKAIINDLNKGLILDMPTRSAYKFLVSLLDKEDKEEMGLDEQMYIDDEEFNKEMGRSKKDALRQEMMFHVEQLMDGNIDKNDFMNVVDDIMMDLGLKEVMGIDRKGRKKPESKSNMTKVSEEEMISKAKYDKLLDNAADRYDELEMQFTKFIKDEYNKDFDIDDFRQFQVDNSIMEDEDMTKLKENFKRFM